MTTRSGPNESYPDPATEQLLAATLDQIRGSIDPSLAEAVLPSGSVLLGVRTEVYQSPTLQAGRDAMPGRYAPVDRSLIILSLQADR